MPCIKSTWWCFTLNFEGELPSLVFSENEVQYACWQHERVAHDHIQGVIQFKNKNTTLLRARSVFDHHRPHLEKMRGFPEEAIAYAKKEDTRVAGPWEFGEYLKRRSCKRKMMERYEEDPEDFRLADPSAYRRIKVRKINEEFDESQQFPVFDREWQRKLTLALNEEPDDRTVIWVYGERGNEGKSTYAKYLKTQGWFYTRGGKTENVSYQYIADVEKNAVFDIPRDKESYLQYSLLEMFKDRMIESSKYEPLTATVSNKVHVVVMANFLPDMSKISEDRIVIINCNE